MHATILLIDSGDADHNIRRIDTDDLERAAATIAEAYGKPVEDIRHQIETTRWDNTLWGTLCKVTV